MRSKEPYGRAKKDTGNKSTTNLLSWTLTMSMDTAENVQSRFEIVPKSNKSNISSCAWKLMACWKNTRMDQPCPHGGGAGLWTKKAKATSWWLFYLDVIKFSLKWRWNKDDDIIVDDIIVDDIIVVDNIIRNLTTWLVARIVWLNILASLPCRLCFTGYNYSKLSLWYTVQN